MDIMRMGKNPNYLGSWDLDDLPQQELTLTIRRIYDEEITANGQKENCTVCSFQEEYKPMILNVTNKKMLCKLYKTKDTEKMVGKRITVNVQQVRAFGGIYDALRIINRIPPLSEGKAEICADCGKEIGTTSKMSSSEMAKYTMRKLGRKLCYDCAAAAAKAAKEGSEAG